MTDFPKIMGIVNVTPDSFSDGGRYFDEKMAVNHAFELIADGADIIDIGGESTRPGAESVMAEEEIRRIVPVISRIKKERPDVVISVDTSKFEVASAAIAEGATIINDITSFRNSPKILDLAIDDRISIVIMHIKGEPRTMQLNPQYNNVVDEVFKHLKEKIAIARHRGVNNIIADVGIGFGKTVEHNLELLSNHSKFQYLGVPLLLGISRKTFIGKILEIDNPTDRDLPTALIHALLINSKASIIRVHDVKLMKMLKTICDFLFNHTDTLINC